MDILKAIEIMWIKRLIAKFLYTIEDFLFDKELDTAPTRVDGNENYKTSISKHHNKFD